MGLRMGKDFGENRLESKFGFSKILNRKKMTKKRIRRQIITGNLGIDLTDSLNNGHFIRINCD